MAADDVTIAILAATKYACELLSLLSGEDSKPVPGDCRVKGLWYRFELAWDHYSDRPFTMSELKTTILTLGKLSQSYNMRQVTFQYRIQGRFHAVGRLRNPITPAPARQLAVGSKQVNVPGGHVLWSNFGQPMDFENVAMGVLSLLNHAWGYMVENRRSGRHIRTGADPFLYQDSRRSLRLRISGPPGGRLDLEDVIDVAEYVVECGRLFFMREHHCSFTDTYFPTPRKVTASLTKVVSGNSPM
ncbi:MAG: hypothetical protein Q9209_005619 [Squamulea sp. 1 TL-2023]